jgi:hypothetical protein
VSCAALPALPPLPALPDGRLDSRSRAMNTPRAGRFALTMLLAVYGFSILKHPDLSDAVYNLDLPIHEFGHYLFWPFGQFMHVAGGTIFQVLFPCAFMVYFAKRKDYHAASVVLWWVAENFWNISVYASDAVATELPLLGGGEHDWSYMLGRLGLLARDQQIGHRFWATGVFLYLIAIGGGLIALTSVPAKADVSDESDDRTAQAEPSGTPNS